MSAALSCTQPQQHPAISSLSVNVGQTVQIDLIQEFADPAPTYSVVSGPSGVNVNPTTGLVTYTPKPADIGNQAVTFAATNRAGTSTYIFYFDVLALNPVLTVTGGEFPFDGNSHTVTVTAVGTDGVTPVAGSLAVTYNGSFRRLKPPVRMPCKQRSRAQTRRMLMRSLVEHSSSIQRRRAIALNSGTFTYDGNSHAATPTAVGVDRTTPVNGTFQVTYDRQLHVPQHPGLYPVNATFISNDPNYASTTTTGTLIITSPGLVAPTLSLADGSAPYDGNSHADTAVALGSDGITPVAGNFIFTYNGSTSAPNQAGSYSVTATFISADSNYADTTISGTMTISAVAPTLVVDANPFTYDGTNHAALVTALGVDQVTPVGGSFTVTYAGSSTAPVNAGTYPVTVTFTSSDPNYLSTSTTSSITILPATPSVGLGNGGQWEFTYNGLPQTVIGSAVGIDGLTPINGTFSYAYYNEYGANTQLFGPPLPAAPIDAGYYTFVETFSSLDPNYSDGTFSWNLWINPASPTVSVNGGPYSYSGATPGTVSAVGIDGVTPVAGSITYITYNGSTTAPTTAGSYAVFAEFTSGDPNYYSSSASGTVGINKATPAFSNLSSPTIKAGTTTFTLSGHLAAGNVAHRRRRRGDYRRRSDLFSRGKCQRQFQHHGQHRWTACRQLSHHLRIPRGRSPLHGCWNLKRHGYGDGRPADCFRADQSNRGEWQERHLFGHRYRHTSTDRTVASQHQRHHVREHCGSDRRDLHDQQRKHESKRILLSSCVHQ